MKKLITFILSTLLFVTGVFSQSNLSVNINDRVYEVLRSAEIQQLCTPLANEKPYTQGYIVKKLEEIIFNLEEQEEYDQIEIIQPYLDKFEYEEGQHLQNGYFKIENKDMSFPTSFIFYNTFTTNVGTGLYQNSDQNSTGYETFYSFGFMGNLGPKVSYNTTGTLGLTKMPLELLGEDYSIGEWLYNTKGNQPARTISTYRNNSYLPYKYSKFWDGSCYFFSDFSASGLEGWAFAPALAFAMTGEIHSSLYENRVELGLSRQKREWGAMDTDSSLVLNGHARPFLAAEASFKPFNFLSLSCLTGILEMPNQDYINQNAWYRLHENEDGTFETQKWEDGYFFQNAFSMIKVDFDMTHFHFDFGSTTVWPKRFELGYAFPLVDNVVYQNNIGDNDNLALFGNFKFTAPGTGSIWVSGYLDEINAFTTKFWRKTRAMFAFQSGGKINIPWIPFTTASFRYTKVEPYCYTHHSINYTPWYSQYLSESYTNNGECLGYYLAPNSDEFNFQFDSNPLPYLNLGFQYQLIRHGVDWGSGSVIGSNIYSELRNYDRSDLDKYFLHDGTYEWSNIVSIHCNYDLRQHNLPISVYAGLGYIFDWFTQIEGEPGAKTPYSYVNNDEYPQKNGVVLNLGVSVFFE